MYKAPCLAWRLVALAWLVLLGVSCLAVETDRDIEITGGSESCLTSSCHADLARGPIVHAVGSDSDERPGCLYCHHLATPGRHVFRLAGKGEALCAECHDIASEGRFDHGAAVAGACTECHDPHGGKDKNLLKVPRRALCTGCHDDLEFTDRHSHGPVAKGACLRCHAPHASNFPKLLQAPQSRLCLRCHKQAVETRSGAALPGLGDTLTDPSLRRHRPFAEGKCSGCHRPHRSRHPSLLKGPYPHRYARFAASKYLCFKCHRAKAFTSARTLADTGFRNGNLNLHYRHVNRTKGRTCRFCHEHHAARRDALIRERVPFGRGAIRIASFSKTDRGGKCAPTCHVEVAYDRARPVVNPLRVTPREGEDATPEALMQAEAQWSRAAAERRAAGQE
jgi:predicted CXXCH cytochrome family protein